MPFLTIVMILSLSLARTFKVTLSIYTFNYTNTQHRDFTQHNDGRNKGIGLVNTGGEIRCMNVDVITMKEYVCTTVILTVITNDAFIYMCVRACVRVCACVRARVCAYMYIYILYTYIYI